MEIIAITNLVVTKIISRLKNNNNVILADGAVFQPKLNFGTFKPISKEDEKEVAEKLIDGISKGSVEEEEFEPQLDQTVYSPTLKSTGDLFIRYDGLPSNLLGILRITSYGVTGDDFMSQGQPIEFKNKIEKYDVETKTWSEI